MYEELLFKRGYLITNTCIEDSSNDSVCSIVAKWNKRAIDSLYVYCDPALNAYISDKQNTWILLLGLVLDPLNNIDNPEIIVSILHTKYLRSENEFFDYLDTLTGRFVLLVVSPNKRFVLQDATGNKSLFYSNASSEIILSSHIQLIAEMKSCQIPQERLEFINSKSYKSNVSHFPGALTPYPSIRALTPNTLLDLVRLKVKRFYPRECFKRQRLSADLVEELSYLLSQQVKGLSKKHKLSVSLTGGIDSRLTLATTREFRHSIFYYTFVIPGDSEQQRDAEMAQKLCSTLGLQHHIIQATEEPKSEEDREFLRVFRRNTAFMRADRQGMIAKALYEGYPDDLLHMKSNVSELGKARYRSNEYFLPKHIHPVILSHLYGTNPKSDFCITAFKEFVNLTNLQSAVSLGDDIYDLFHWEHRIGCWQSLQILDFDVSQDTLIPYNNRYILGKMMSISLKERYKKTLYYKIIRHLWPETLKFPCNPWKQKSITQEMRRFGIGIKHNRFGIALKADLV